MGAPKDGREKENKEKERKRKRIVPSIAKKLQVLAIYDTQSSSGTKNQSEKCLWFWKL